MASMMLLVLWTHVLRLATACLGRVGTYPILLDTGSSSFHKPNYCCFLELQPYFIFATPSSSTWQKINRLFKLPTFLGSKYLALLLKCLPIAFAVTVNIDCFLFTLLTDKVSSFYKINCFTRIQRSSDILWHRWHRHFSAPFFWLFLYIQKLYY